MTAAAAAAVDGGRCPPGADEGNHAWEQVRTWWHVAFALAMTITAVLSLIVSGPWSHRIGAVLCVAAMSAVYATLGVRMWDEADGGWARRHRLYFWSMTALLALGLALMPTYFVTLFILIPQVYADAPTFRRAVPMVLVLQAIALVATARWHDPPWNGEAWAQAVVQSGVLLLFGLGLGAFISRIIDESRQRAELIAELQGTREELAAAHRDAGAQAERARLAHEIHDTLAQGFTSVVLLAQAAGAALGREHPARRHLDAIERTARENLAEARALVAELAPPALASGSLPAAVGRLADRLASEVGLETDVAVTGPVRPLAVAQDVAVLRAVQEALANVRRHAAARRVVVDVGYTDSGVQVAVRDDGCGFDVASGGRGYGLEGMRTRLQQVGGSARVRSAPGAGTVIDAWIGEAPA